MYTLPLTIDVIFIKESECYLGYHFFFFIDLYAIIMLMSSCYLINMAQKKEQAGDSVGAHIEDDRCQFGSFIISITTSLQTS